MAKKIGIFVGVCALILGIAIAVLLFNLNPIVARLKPQLLALIAEKVGHPVEFEKLEVRLFPTTKLQLNNVVIAKSAENSIGVVSLKTSLPALIRGEISVDELELRDANLSITRRADKRLFLGPIPLQKAELEGVDNEDGELVRLHTVAAVAPAGTTEQSNPVALQIRTVELANITVHFDDQAVTPAQRITLKSLHGSAENIAPMVEGKIDLHGTFLSSSSDNLSAKGTLMLQGGPAGLPKTDISIALNALDLPSLQNLVQVYGSKVPDLALGKTADLDLGVAINERGISVRSKGLDFGDSAVSLGTMFNKAAGVPLSLAFEGQPSITGGFTGKSTTLTLGKNVVQAPFGFDPAKGLAAKVQTSSFSLADLASMIPLLQPFKLGGEFDADFQVTQPKNKSPLATGNVSLNDISATVPAKTGNGLPISRLSGKVEIKNDAIRSEGLTVHIAGQQFTIGVDGTMLPNPALNWKINSSQLELQSILAGLAIDNPALASASFSQLALSGSHDGNSRKGSSSIAFGSGAMQGMAIQKTNLGVQYELDEKNTPRRIEVTPSTLGIFGGTLTLEATIADGNGLASARGAKMQLQPISALALASSPLQLIGLLEEMRLRARFAQANVKPSLQGEFEALARNGELQGFNLLRETFGRAGSLPGLDGGLDKYFPPEYAELLKGNATKFDTLSIKTTFAQQQVAIQSVDMVYSLYILSAQGKAGFDGRLELQAQLKLTPLLSEKMVLRQPKLELLLDDKRNLVIPLVIKKADSVMVLPDVSELGKRALKNTAKEAVTRELQKGLDKVSPGVGKALEGLFR
jgi:hypothetical protein